MRSTGERLPSERGAPRREAAPTPAEKRNVERFPADVMLRLTATEAKLLEITVAISRPGRGGQGYRTYAFHPQSSSCMHRQ